MSRKVRHILESDSTDYHKGYADGMKAAFEESELDAYYAGVGYGKKSAGDKHIGFSSDEERRQFEAGMKNKSKHFRSYRSEPPTFFERLFGIHRKDRPTGDYKKQRTRKTKKYVNRKRRRSGRRKRRNDSLR